MKGFHKASGGHWFRVGAVISIEHLSRDQCRVTVFGGEKFVVGMSADDFAAKVIELEDTE